MFQVLQKQIYRRFRVVPYASERVSSFSSDVLFGIINSLQHVAV